MTSDSLTNPAWVFQAANTLALVTWLALLVALVWPAARARVFPVTGLGVPVIFALAYLVLLADLAGQGGGGGFGSIPEVRALFASDAGLAAGWLHYLAFDLFVGTWIARDGIEKGRPGWLIAPCLVFCFLFGPAGLLLHLVLRRLRREA